MCKMTRPKETTQTGASEKLKLKEMFHAFLHEK